MAAAHDEATALARLSRLVVPRLADWCIFDMIGEDGVARRAAILSADHELAHYTSVLADRFPLDLAQRENIVVRVLESGKPLLIVEMTDEILAATARDADHLALLRLGNIGSTIIVPLIARGRALGAITLVTTVSGRRYAEGDLALAQALAYRAAISVDAARLLRAAETAQATAERAANRMTHLQTVTAALSEAPTLARVAEVVVRQGVSALDAQSGVVALLTDEGDFRLVAHMGAPEEVVTRLARFPRESALPVAVAVRTGAAIWERSRDAYAAAHPELTTPPAFAEDYAFAALPLWDHGTIVGGIGLGFDRPREFTEEDRDFGLGLARLCSQAMERARLYEAERTARSAAERAQARDRFLADAGSALAGSLDWEVTLGRVADLAVPSLADWCFVDVLGDDGALRRVVVAHAFPGDAAKDELAATLRRWPPQLDRSSGAGSIVRTGKPVLVVEMDDATLRRVAIAPEHLTALRAAGYRSYVAAPLRARRRVFGVIAFATAESGRRYDPGDLRLVEDLASRAALAIDNARLYGDQVAARALVQELAAERTRVLAQIVDGVLITDASGVITFANEAAVLLHGESPLGLDPDAYGRRFRLRARDGEPLAPGDLPISRALARGETVNGLDVRIGRADGGETVVEISAAPVRTDDDRLIGVVLTLNDVTAEREFEARKDEFIVRVSHDLKTPLTSIKGWAQLMHARSGRDPEAARHLPGLDAIVRQSQTMQRLLDQLLETARSQLSPDDPRDGDG